MAYRVIPSAGLRGQITPPGDKSISHRLLLFAALANGTSAISGLLDGDDVRATQHALGALGVQFNAKDGRLHVIPPTQGLMARIEKPLWCGNSGTTMRLLTGLLAGQHVTATLTGDVSLTRRPMGRIKTPLELMGARVLCEGAKATAPVTVTRGATQGLRYRLPVASAQVKSSIILAGLQHGVQLHEPGQSRDHTERLLRHLGLDLFIDENGWLNVAKMSNLPPFSLNVPGDMSAAAFWLVAGSIVRNSELSINNVGLNPTRTGALDALFKMGADISVAPSDVGQSWEPKGTITVRTKHLHGTVLDGELALRCLDEIPVLAVAAAFASGVSEFRDIGELRHKESDRIHSVAQGLSDMGVNVTEFDDGLRIHGGVNRQATTINCAHDHRIAMAFAVAGVAGGDIRLSGAQSVQTSYPQFFHELERLSV